MAQLKDLIVNGVSRFLGKVNAGTVEATSFVKSGGTSSQFLKADGSIDSNAYITAASVTDTKVTQTVTSVSNTSWRPLIIGGSYSDAATFSPSTVTDTTYASHLAKYAPSTGILAVVGLNKMTTSGTVTTGSNTTVWNTNGGTSTLPAAPGTINTTATTAQGTSASEALSGSITLHKVSKTGTYSDLIGTPTIPTITLNGSSTTSASLYAPTTAGTSGQVLTSNGSGAPTWQAAPSGPTSTTYNLNNTFLRIAAPTSAAGNSIIQIITNQNERPILHILNFGFAYDEEPWAVGWLFGNSGQSAISDSSGENEILLAQNPNTYAMALYFPISDSSATAEVTVLYGATPSISVVSGLASGEQWLEYADRWITLGTSSTSVVIDDTNNRLRFNSNGFYTNLYYSTIVDDGGGESSSNKVTSLSSSSTTAQYPSAKTTYDEIHPAIGSSMPSGGFEPNKEYNLGSVTGTKTFSIKTSNIDTNVSNYYFWTFSTSSTAPTITWPSGLTWQGGSAPTIAASKYYEILVRKSGSSYYATYLEF